MYRLLVSGSREWAFPNILGMVLLEEWMKHPDLVIIQGDAQGADRMAKEWGIRHLGMDRVENYPAPWDLYGKGAGGIRNQRMVDTNPDKAIFFFWTPDSKGTLDCLKRAERAGIPHEKYGRFPV